jgi:DNA-binding MarR family transcriptional regulator
MPGDHDGRPRPAARDFVDTVVDLTQRRAEGADPETTALVVVLLRAVGRHRGLFEQRAHDQHGRHLRAFSVLYLVWLYGTLEGRDLARLLGMSRQTTSAALGALESAGLVCRERDASGDRRLVEVRLTDDGRRTVEQEFRAQHGVDARWLSVLTPAERRTLRELLERLVTQNPGEVPLVG